MGNRRIAVVGAGFAGIATCWYLLQFPDCTVQLLDKGGIASGASGIAPGLLHTFAGNLAIPHPLAGQALSQTRELLEKASQGLGEAVYKADGLFRAADGTEQVAEFQKRQQEFSRDLEWWSKEAACDNLPGYAGSAGLFIRSGITVNARF